MKITLAELQKLNKKLHNDFKVNVAMLQYYNDKEAHKTIELENGNKLEISIGYREIGVYKRQVIMHFLIAYWKKSTISDGMYLWADNYSFSIGEPKARKNFNDIAEVTKDYSNEKCLQLAYENIEMLKGA